MDLLTHWTVESDQVLVFWGCAREIVKQIQPKELSQEPDTARPQRVIDKGAVVEAELDLIDTWGK